jgi:AraC family transcriptional regulator, ethanolamine operon transcriptional activator
MLAATFTQELRDPEDCARLFGRWNGTFEQLSAGPLRGRIEVAQGELTRAFRLSINRSILARGSDRPATLSFSPVLPSCARTVWQGRALDPGWLVARGPDVPIDNRPGAAAVIPTLLVAPGRLRRAAWALAGVDLKDAPFTWQAIQPPPEAQASFARRLTELIEAGPSREREEHCLRALLAALLVRTGERGLPASARATLARRAEELIRSHLGGPLSTIELCKELAVPERTLRQAFRERFLVGPLAFHRALRLNAVRAALRRSPAAGVAATAARWGFAHFGRFAAEYHRRFGEYPSQT